MEELQRWEGLYLEIGFHLDKYIEGFVDSYYGPPQFKQTIKSMKASPIPELESKCEELLSLIHELECEESRKVYLLKQVHAIATSIKVLGGQQLGFLKEVNGYFDITPKKIDDSELDRALSVLDEIIPGTGSIHERLISHRKNQFIPRKKLLYISQLIMAELQSHSQEIISLPQSEHVKIQLVSGQSWGAYNWYLGNYESKIEINGDIERNLLSLTFLLAHEGYTGHHLEHCIKEQVFFQEKGYIEHSIILIRAPECLISEGIATMGIYTLFTKKELFEWIAEDIAPSLKMELDPQLEYDISQATQILFRYTPYNSALLLYADKVPENEVRQYFANYYLSTPKGIEAMMLFIKSPIWRPYIFNYVEGRNLVQNFLGDPIDINKFRTLLTSQIIPSQLAKK